MATSHLRPPPPAVPSPPPISHSSSSSRLRFPTANSREAFPTSSPASPSKAISIARCAGGGSSEALRTCKQCKTLFDPSLNHPQACRFHTAHFGGETRRKFESVYSGGTMNTPDSGKVFQYWHCCGSEDPFDPGCTAAPHLSYDDE